MAGSKTERVSAAVTPEEQRRIKVVAGLRDTDVSNLLRDMSITAILAEFRRAQGEEVAA